MLISTKICIAQKQRWENIQIDRAPDESDIPPIIHSEVQTAINQMKRNKAPGIDQITTDIIMLGWRGSHSRNGHPIQ